LATHSWLCGHEVVVETLMIPLLMRIGQVTLEQRAKGCLTDHDHLMEDFLFDRAHEPFAVGIEIRTPWWHDDGLHSFGAKYLVEAMQEFRGAIVEQIQFAPQEAIEGIS